MKLTKEQEQILLEIIETELSKRKAQNAPTEKDLIFYFKSVYDLSYKVDKRKNRCDNYVNGKLIDRNTVEYMVNELRIKFPKLQIISNEYISRLIDNLISTKILIDLRNERREKRKS